MGKDDFPGRENEGAILIFYHPNSSGCNKGKQETVV